jgi:hypothetical protein
MRKTGPDHDDGVLFMIYETISSPSRICKKQRYADHPVTQRRKASSGGAFPSRIASW